MFVIRSADIRLVDKVLQLLTLKSSNKCSYVKFGYSLPAMSGVYVSFVRLTTAGPKLSARYRKVRGWIRPHSFIGQTLLGNLFA